MNLENNKNKTTPLVLVILLVLFAFVFGGGTCQKLKSLRECQSSEIDP